VKHGASFVWFLVGLGTGLLLAKGLAATRYQTTQVSLSPDERYRVRILDPGISWVDRNFQIRVERMDDHREITIFQSPDEDPPPGRERIVWSQNGKRFVIVGPRFIVVGAPRKPDKEVLYLMADVESGRVWCNSNQQTAHPHFTCKDLPPMRWGGPCAAPVP
jgi:hypothetical protein